MSKFRFHKLAALVVLAGFAAWMGTGEFSSVGSAANEDQAKTEAAEQPAAPLRTVAVVTPPRVQHARAIRISGKTDAEKRVTLATRVMGVIESLPVKQGQRVERGDLIMRLDARDKEAAVRMAESVVAQRQAEAEAAERLVGGGNAPKLQADQARAALATATSQLESAKAELAQYEMYAPYNGVVDRVPVQPGSTILAGAEVATLINLDPLLAIGEVSERDLRYLKIGDKAEIRLVDGTTVQGTLRYISRDASSATRTYRIEVAIPNENKELPAGMTAEIKLLAESTDAVALPRSVVTLSGAGDLGIRAVDKDDKVVFFPIDLVDDTPNGLLLGGIPADARIIVAGQDLVTEGDTVKAVEADQETINKLVGEAQSGTQ
ncbi:efflux RND transporter periplasmic adaptor subunit [Allomesorhizobium alhagi]|jgi:multidrug efflux system membrane fusion protein|uniref:RND family efflux transporter MFP subunit n=1 Tax=Mesorhizobium alhagi CCNWXJ12-2 TaxID=1107882 RepID=H0HLT0_9HYPH|nr:efflux RND transporter periplasmic adaptor subunit [Mesorhizobium alhagi]EHK58338.1 RND family efflux transporter MFP subunit [Mesorhizobium alhagi CCNWXJ12-2]